MREWKIMLLYKSFCVWRHKKNTLWWREHCWYTTRPHVLLRGCWCQWCQLTHSGAKRDTNMAYLNFTWHVQKFWNLHANFFFCQWSIKLNLLMPKICRMLLALKSWRHWLARRLKRGFFQSLWDGFSSYHQRVLAAKLYSKGQSKKRCRKRIKKQRPSSTLPGSTR